MKNLIDPKILAELKQEPFSYERVAVFLKENQEITAARLCRLLDADPQQYYNWKSRGNSRSATAEGEFDVVATGAGKKSYSASDKLKLVKRYASLEGEKPEFLRSFGLYDSDLTRWQEKVDEAALAALSTRKPRCDKKSAEQLENERLKADIRGQEKTIAKLSAIVVAQKKISELLIADDSD